MSVAIGFEQPGPPEVLRPFEEEPRSPGSGEVRVAVKAAGVQPVDALVRAQGYLLPGARVDGESPRVVGNEFAGVIGEIGEGVGGLHEDDEVIGFTTMGAYAEQVTVAAENLARKPAAMPWAEAGALSASGQSAYRALRHLAVGQGDTVLVHAAAGGVGTMAVQVARAWGAIVIGTASERNHDYLGRLGAIPVAYGPGLAERVRELAPQGVDAALDAIGGEALDVSVELVADRDRIATLVAFDRVEELGLRPVGGERSAAWLAELCNLYERGELRVHVSRTFPLAAAAEAHREIETGHVRGKLVLTLDDAGRAEAASAAT